MDQQYGRPRRHQGGSKARERPQHPEGRAQGGRASRHDPFDFFLDAVSNDFTGHRDPALTTLATIPILRMGDILLTTVHVELRDAEHLDRR